MIWLNYTVNTNMKKARVLSLDHHSESSILETAKSVFLKRGYFGTRMQEIADSAGINKAMLHYYFRSKDKIFDAIFKESFNSIFPKILEILDSDEPFEQKIHSFFSRYIDILLKHPHIPGFVMHEIAHNPERLKTFFQQHLADTPKKFVKQVKQEIDAGHIVKMDPRQIIVNILCLAVFPFAAKPLIQHVLNLKDSDYKDFMLERKKILPEFVMRAIRT
jgi:TetR/AcrR family transcriptional regulator